eukprot:15364458-Ditylum_brightwellii.AAC.2
MPPRCALFSPCMIPPNITQVILGGHASAEQNCTRQRDFVLGWSGNKRDTRTKLSLKKTIQGNNKHSHIQAEKAAQ